MDFEGMRLVRLNEEYTFKPFDCGNHDLNLFLFDDSKTYLKNRLSVTYILENDKETIGYFSVSNDKLSIADTTKAKWRRIKRLFSHNMHRKDYPAVKIGRLAIDKRYQGSRIGSDILNFIKCMFKENNRTGCAFITVDALPAALTFYIKNRFKCLDSDFEDTTVTYTKQMYFDLNELT